VPCDDSGEARELAFALLMLLIANLYEVGRYALVPQFRACPPLVKLCPQPGDLGRVGFELGSQARDVQRGIVARDY
jgi:hypothetical protein